MIAVLAPVMGARADETGRRRFWLGAHTAVVVVLSAAMFFVRPAPGSLTQNVLLGIFLLAAGNIFFELAAVNYNATLSQVSTRANVGRVSGFGWGAGYLGGIVLLLILFFGFINPEVGLFGVTGADGLNVRVSMLVAAVWFGAFALPVLIAVPAAPPTGGGDRREPDRRVPQAVRRHRAAVARGTRHPAVPGRERRLPRRARRGLHVRRGRSRPEPSGSPPRR